MLGLSRNDASQQKAVASYRDSFMPYRDGFAIKPSRSAGPIMITAQQRDILVEAYSRTFLRVMRIMMALLLGGTGLVIAVLVAFDIAPEQWIIMLSVFAIIMLVLVLQQRAMRQTIAALGPRPSVLPSEYAAWRRQRVRDRSWSAILLPALAMPVMVLRWHMHWPPQSQDDYFGIVFLAALAALWTWAILRKLQANRV